MRKSVKTWFPVRNIENGIIELKDGRYCKVTEVYPVNFSLKSKEEQESILYEYKNFLHTCDFNIQILIQSKKGNLDKHISQIEKNMRNEERESIKNLMKAYTSMIKNETLKSAVTKRFFIVFSAGEAGKISDKSRVYSELAEKALKIKNALGRCGNDVKEFDKSNDELIDILYTYINPVTSEIQDFKEPNDEYKNI